MTEIRVRQCTARVRRRGGWGWGDPEMYVDGVVAAIEGALRRAVDEAAVPSDAELTLDGSINVVVAPDGRVTAASHRVLVERLRSAAAAASAPTPAPAGGPPAASPEQPASVDAASPGDPVPPVVALFTALTAWSRSGRLDAVLRSWPQETVAAWAAALLRSAEVSTAGPTRMSAEAVDAIAHTVLDEHAAPAGDRDPGAGFLLLTAAVAAALGDEVPDRATLVVVARRAGLRHQQLTTSPPHPAADRSQPRPGKAVVSRSDPAPPLVPGSAEVVPALPFLVLVQLHRLGFVAPATATLAAAGLAPAGASLAAAVAGKALPPPRHGWQRTPAERHAVELASGLSADQVDAVAGLWRDHADAVGVPLRTVLAGLYVEGRSRYDELVVTRVGDELLWGEEAGLLPVAWASREDDLSAVAAVLGDPPLRDSQALAPVAAAFAPRRGLPGRDVPEVERLLGAVTGTALGSLAQELWGQEADAVLGLERLGDLEALVRVGDRTTIAVPRGQRWLDLRRIGLLDAWPAPWAPGGLWEVVTW